MEHICCHLQAMCLIPHISSQLAQAAPATAHTSWRGFGGWGTHLVHATRAIECSRLLDLFIPPALPSPPCYRLFSHMLHSADMSENRKEEEWTDRLDEGGNIIFGLDCPVTECLVAVAHRLPACAGDEGDTGIEKQSHCGEADLDQSHSITHAKCAKFSYEIKTVD